MLEPSTADAPALPQPLPVHWVERLFERLAAILGARIADIVAGADPKDVKREWAEALAGYTDDELRRGIAATRTRKFPPNLPEFLHLCRPALDPEVAWQEAELLMPLHVKGEPQDWSHPAVYWAARQMQHELRTSRYAEQRKRWDRLMADEWRKGVWCAPPDPTQRALQAPQQQELGAMSKAEAVQRMREIRERHRQQEALKGELKLAEEGDAQAAGENRNEAQP